MSYILSTFLLLTKARIDLTPCHTPKDKSKTPKKYFKIFIGIAVLILVIVVFFFAQRSDTLETGTLKNWRAATIERRISAAQIMTGAT